MSDIGRLVVLILGLVVVVAAFCMPLLATWIYYESGLEWINKSDGYALNWACGCTGVLMFLIGGFMILGAVGCFEEVRK